LETYGVYGDIWTPANPSVVFHVSSAEVAATTWNTLNACAGQQIGALDGWQKRPDLASDIKRTDEHGGFLYRMLL
jgi:hypothetical protein